MLSESVEESKAESCHVSRTDWRSFDSAIASLNAMTVWTLGCAILAQLCESVACHVKSVLENLRKPLGVFH